MKQQSFITMATAITAVAVSTQTAAFSQSRSTWIDTNGHSIEVQGASIMRLQCEGMRPGGSVESAKQLSKAIQATIQCSESQEKITTYFCESNKMPKVRPWARSCGMNGWVRTQ